MSDPGPLSLRLVVDTNVLLRGLLNTTSASGRILAAADRRSVVVVLSKPLLAEYVAVLTDETLTERYPELTAEKVQVALRRLRYLSDFKRTVRERFEFPRDPRDSMLIEIALAGNATHLLSTDNDLLSLPTSYSDAARRLRQRLPRLQIMPPVEFMKQYEHLLPVP